MPNFNVKERETAPSTTTQTYMGTEASNARTAGRKLGFYNKRTEALWKRREALDPSRAGGSGIYLPDDQELLSDLTSVRFSAVQHRGVMCIKAETKLEVCKRLGRLSGSCCVCHRAVGLFVAA